MPKNTRRVSQSETRVASMKVSKAENAVQNDQEYTSQEEKTAEEKYSPLVIPQGFYLSRGAQIVPEQFRKRHGANRSLVRDPPDDADRSITQHFWQDVMWTGLSCSNDLIAYRLGRGYRPDSRQDVPQLALSQTIFGPTKTVSVGADPLPAQQGVGNLLLCFFYSQVSRPCGDVNSSRQTTHLVASLAEAQARPGKMLHAHQSFYALSGNLRNKFPGPNWVR